MPRANAERVAPVSSLVNRARELLPRDAWLPQNQVDSDKLVGTLLAGCARPSTLSRPIWSSSTRARSSRRLARSRSTRCSPSTSGGATAVASSSRGAWPSATGRNWPPHCPRSIRWPGSASASGQSRPATARAGPATTHPDQRHAGPRVRPAQPARPKSPAPWATSRSPKAATASAASAPSHRSAASSAAATWPRSSPKSTSRRRGDRPRRPGPRLVRQGPSRRPRRRGDRPARPGGGERVPRVRLLYLYPSDLSDELIGVVPDRPCRTSICLQHVGKSLLRRMRRWGDGDRFLRRIADIRARRSDAAFRSNFIVGYPGESEDDHDQLLRFVEVAQLDWCGFFAYQPRGGHLRGRARSAGACGTRHRTPRRADPGRHHGGSSRSAHRLVRRGPRRPHRDRPEPPRGPRIDGVVLVDSSIPAGTFADVTIVDALSSDHRRRSNLSTISETLDEL